MSLPEPSQPPTDSASDAGEMWRRYPQGTGEGHTVVGDLRVFEGFHSARLGNRRDVLVYLPPSYESGTARYPVLYMQDGQNLFNEATAFAGEWRVDNTMNRLSRKRGLEAIVVGVFNAGGDRLHEYSPFEDDDHGGGRGDRYLGFLADALKPRIDRDFRTRPDRANTFIAGSSMGGLISLYAFFRRPEVFGGAAAMSPSLWFADGALFSFVEAAPFTPGRLYLDVGTGEGEGVLADVRRMKSLLLERGYRPRRDLLYVERAQARHSERAWRQRFRRAAAFLLRGTPGGEEGG
ncbi:MAG: alpha/beta hydrolase-fold protein [Rubricoccaceae bacterium]|nr:alpha/beta hydrolase-fold protein [Rubricoccaceae bacterium]